MKEKLFLLSIMMSLFFAGYAQNKKRSSIEKPNIIVIYTDDHGYADMGVQGQVTDVKTPNVDALVKSGIRAINGYSTAPQCVPSRAGLLAGRSQNRFGLESNVKEPTVFEQQNTLPERLKEAGYVTAQFGKWHLGKPQNIVDNGFDHIYPQNSAADFPSNIDINGNDRELSIYKTQAYHVDACSQAAAGIIKRYKNDPFFLYLAYRAPHVPLDPPQKYVDRFPEDMPRRRRLALAMLSAVDDGVGLIRSTLKEEGLLENTLIFYIADNGAPYKITKEDKPGIGPGWDGSLNDPLNGEKGTLMEGGIHVPFAISWPGQIQASQEYEHPIWTLDVAATSVALAGLKPDPKLLDGVNLMPYLSGKDKSAPHDMLAWRWIAQAAIRQGKWKYLIGGEREYLFDLDADIEETKNLIGDQPRIAKELKNKLVEWTDELQPPGLATGPMSKNWTNYFDFYLDKKYTTTK